MEDRKTKYYIRVEVIDNPNIHLNSTLFETEEEAIKWAKHIKMLDISFSIILKSVDTFTINGSFMFDNETKIRHLEDELGL